MVRRVLYQTAISLSLATGVGLIVAVLFVISLTNIRLEWAIQSGWLVILVAAVFLSLHLAISYVFIKPVLEFDEETGIENLTPGEARQAIDRIGTFIPVSAFMAAANWALGGLCVAVGVRVLYDVVLSDLIALWMGAMSSGLVITVIFHQAIKLRFRSVTDILIQRAQINSSDDPIFERQRTSLRKELASSFFTLIIVALAFSVMFGYSQTTSRVSLTVARQLSHDLSLFEKKAAENLGVGWSVTTDAAVLQPLLAEAPPSPGGKLFLLENGAPLLPTGDGTLPITNTQREFIAESEGADWLQQRDGSILSWTLIGNTRLVAWVPAHDLEVSSRDVFLTLLILSAVLVATMLGVANFLAQSITRPLLELRDVMNGLARGDLVTEHIAGGFTEVGELSVSAAATIDALRATVTEIRDAHSRVDYSAQRVGGSTGEVRWASTEQAKLLETTLGSLHDVEASIREINRSVEQLDRASEGALRSINELNTGTSGVQSGANEVIDAVAETHASIHEMAASIAEVTQSMEYLKQTSSATAQGTAEMASTIQVVEVDARETAALADQVLQDARAGQDAVLQTRTGIEHIQAATLEAVNTIKALSTEMGQIGHVLTVIDEVTNQTQLLSLNAAIIAAQAGEHGQGFAVVADEIKKLAVRTAESTGEIGNMLKRIEHQARMGVEKAMAGEAAVAEGSQLSELASDALAQIERSARESTERMGRIAHATGEQTRGINHIGQMMENMVQNVSRVLVSTVEQRKGADRISESSDAMRIVAERVGVSAQQQNQNSAAIADNMRQVAEMVDQVLAATRAQLDQIAKATGSANETAELAGRNLTLTEQLREVVIDLEKESKSLTDSLQRFKLTHEENGRAG